MSAIEVVSAVIVRAGRILLTQRPAGKDFGFTWESPGGKVEGNESHHGALERELREELGIERPRFSQLSIWCGDFANEVRREDRRNVFVLLYPTWIDNDDAPRPLEGQGLGWFTAEEFERLELAPANYRARHELVGHLRARARLEELGAKSDGELRS